MALVYILEDDRILAGTICKLIDSLGHSCESFVDCDSFIAAVKRTPPAAFLVDMWLGPTTALEVVSGNADLLAGIPAIMISGGNGEVSLEKVTAIADIEGFGDVLYKPFERKELQAVLTKHLKPNVT